MTKRQEICYGIAVAAIFAAVALIEQMPVLAIAALVVSVAAERLAR